MRVFIFYVQPVLGNVHVEGGADGDVELLQRVKHAGEIVPLIAALQRMRHVVQQT